MPRKSRGPEPPTITRTTFELRPLDGQPSVRGDVRVLTGTRPASAVVVCHGFKGFREWGFFPPLARALAVRGHAAVTFDFSRNGVGADGVDFSALELFAEQTHSRNVDEIRMVTQALMGGELLPHAPSRVGLLGHSRGGGEAVLATSEDPHVDALVTWAAIGSVHRWTPEQTAAWERGERVEVQNQRTGQAMPVGPAYWRDLVEHPDRLDVRAAAAEVAVPWLIVHGERDTSVSPDDARALFDAAGENAELFLIEDADHTFGAAHPFGEAPDALRAAAEATLEWFGEHLA